MTVNPSAEGFTSGESERKVGRVPVLLVDAWASPYDTTSRPFDRPETGKIAVKVINDYGDEVICWWGEPDLENATVWIGLNPATGDTDGKPRPTLAGCVARSKTWGNNGLLFLDLFAYRATKPKSLALADDPVGPINDLILESVSGAAGRTVAAWGGGGSLLGRSSMVAKLLSDAQGLGTTRRGEPRHPRYVARSTPLSPWPIPGARHSKA